MADGSVKMSRRTLAPPAAVTRLRRSLEYLLTAHTQPGNGGKKLVQGAASKDMPTAPETDLDRTNAAARKIIEADAERRSEKIARLKAARSAGTKTTPAARHPR